MGFTGLARWVNAPTTGMELVTTNIVRNHHGTWQGPWLLSIRSYRSTLASIPGVQIHAERTMCALTMNDNVFVLLEDPSAPTSTETLAQAAAAAAAHPDSHSFVGPSHHRSTFLTLRPPGALEQLLAQLRARWLSVRQSSAAAPHRNQNQASQLTVDGNCFKIGKDWLVRIGTVTLAGGSPKGMLLEAEYLPLPVLHSKTPDGTSELLSGLLTTILPNIRDAKTVAVTISDEQWEEALWDREEEEMAAARERKAKERQDNTGPDNAKNEPPADDDIYMDGEADIPVQEKGDWIGVERDRRSAFLIIGALRSEGIL
ncbi:hypothetical protein PLICRDRAFT_128707 [Plicaturopsis crispa FD-325 SS-3]|nr:hypothetical protein PLICRDRAFT_128707 [Plicaturopsis crispa FD-325 SS-3]